MAGDDKESGKDFGEAEATQTKRAWLDEGLPVGVLNDEQSEQLWEACSASHTGDPFAEWEKRKGQEG
jgi:hypothetical protein